MSPSYLVTVGYLLLWRNYVLEACWLRHNKKSNDWSSLYWRWTLEWTWIGSGLEMSTAPGPRGAVLENFAAYQPRRVTFESVKPRQCRVPRGRSSNDESLQNEETEVIVSDNNSYFSCLSYSCYLRCSNASGQRFVGRIMLLVFL